MDYNTANILNQVLQLILILGIVAIFVFGC